jgi:hypothetical protein
MFRLEAGAEGGKENGVAEGRVAPLPSQSSAAATFPAVELR